MIKSLKTINFDFFFIYFDIKLVVYKTNFQNGQKIIKLELVFNNRYFSITLKISSLLQLTGLTLKITFEKLKKKTYTKIVVEKFLYKL